MADTANLVDTAPGTEACRVHIRWMIRRDMPEVLRIEQQSFEHAWEEEDFRRCLRQRNCIGMIAEHGEQIVGFMLYELHKTSLYVLNLAVHPGWRRLDIGSQMAQKLISKLSSHRRTHITLEVRESNLPAQLFFRGQGFKASQVLRRFYDDSHEDAYRFEYVHVPPPDELLAADPLDADAEDCTGKLADDSLYPEE